jgi:hypothetical protein
LQSRIAEIGFAFFAIFGLAGTLWLLVATFQGFDSSNNWLRFAQIPFGSIGRLDVCDALPPRGESLGSGVTTSLTEDGMQRWIRGAATTTCLSPALHFSEY